jgi:hypothetical protein
MDTAANHVARAAVNTAVAGADPFILTAADLVEGGGEGGGVASETPAAKETTVNDDPTRHSPVVGGVMYAQPKLQGTNNQNRADGADAKLRPILTNLRPSSAEFMHKLDAFLANKTMLEAVEAAAAPPEASESVAVVTVADVHNEPGKHDLQYYRNMHQMVGEEHVTMGPDVTAMDVLVRMVIDVVHSREVVRLIALADVSRDDLQEYDLALYLFELVVAVTIETHEQEDKDVR